MTSSQHRVYFMRELETERNTLRAFIEILKKEENALIEGRIEKIESLQYSSLNLFRSSSLSLSP